MSLKIGNAADPQSCYAELSYWGHPVCRVGLYTKLNARAVPWALDSKACDFIDHYWSQRLHHGARVATCRELEVW
ncbi:hypothetical protein [Variovorax sp. IB41]|uniref:hypothetical protein n=1 Tax=Variovorax sp. IB41 TaxID=2779370 RepID=UPI0018E81A3A|nr:hypothetical protein [Variovorax sp. IB41]MBJ2154603.1 hypothetical protein [Variovorax sp. IB41]